MDKLDSHGLRAIEAEGHFVADSGICDVCIDAIVDTGKYIYVFKFKLDRNDSALAQIKGKEFFRPYLRSPKKITLASVNVDTNTARLPTGRAWNCNNGLMC